MIINLYNLAEHLTEHLGCQLRPPPDGAAATGAGATGAGAAPPAMLAIALSILAASLAASARRPCPRTPREPAASTSAPQSAAGGASLPIMASSWLAPSVRRSTNGSTTELGAAARAAATSAEAAPDDFRQESVTGAIDAALADLGLAWPAVAGASLEAGAPDAKDGGVSRGRLPNWKFWSVGQVMSQFGNEPV